MQFRIFDATLMVDASREGTIMIEQVPFIFEPDDGVMSRPADYRRKDRPLEGIWAHRIPADGIDELMRGTGRVG